MTMTGFKFNAKDADQASPRDDMRKTFGQAQGFGVTGMNFAAPDPSLKKMKEDIALKEIQNREMEDEITRLRY